MKYNTIFFDLDHTLWDYEKNSSEALTELYNKYNLYKLGGFSCTAFIKRFSIINYGLWDQFNHGIIGKEEIRRNRFTNIFKHFKVTEPSLSLEISDEYLKLCPTKTNLFPHAHDVLTYLQGKYKLYILTNGFNEVQQIKVSSSNIGNYFQGMITSDTTGHKKPNREIFDHALQVAGIKCSEGVMIGDSLNADIVGAQNAEIDGIFFNPAKVKHKEKPSAEINCLSELMNIL